MKSYVVAGLMMCTLAACGGGADDSAIVKTKQGSQPALGASAPETVQNEITIAGYRDNYTITVGASGDVSLLDKLSGATQVFKGIKLIKFFDQHTSFDLTGVDGQVYRLYQAAFNRKPDLGGLGFWIKAARAGMSLKEIADGFLRSEEFQQMYGKDVINTKFVSLLYNNVLHREPEQAGYDWWVTQVNNGAIRSEVLFGFSDSKENRDNLLSAMANGFDFEPFQPTGPIIPKSSSYENKVAAGAVLGPQQMPSEVTYSNSVAFGDFFHDGTYSMVTHTQDYFVNGIPDITRLGHIKFYKRSADGSWIDNTSTLLADTKGCLHSRKAISADFNGDGKPDVFFACQGFDRPPYPGEAPHILLSQPNGTYKNITLPITCFCHAASAVDFNGNGFADILVTDTTVLHQPFFLRNNKDGTFTTDTTMLPPSLKYKQIFSAELIDFNHDGKYDVWLGGHESDSSVGSGDGMKPRIFINDSKNSFVIAKEYMLPVSDEFGLPLDVIVANDKIYMLRTNIEGGSDSYEKSFYSKVAVQLVDFNTLSSSIVYRHEGQYLNGMTWVNWLIPYNGSVVAMDKAYDINVK